MEQRGGGFVFFIRRELEAEVALFLEGKSAVEIWHELVLVFAVEPMAKSVLDVTGSFLPTSRSP